MPGSICGRMGWDGHMRKMFVNMLLNHGRLLRREICFFDTIHPSAQCCVVTGSPYGAAILILRRPDADRARAAASAAKSTPKFK